MGLTSQAIYMYMVLVLLTLTLFMPGVRADHTYDTATFNDLTVATHFFY